MPTVARTIELPADVETVWRWMSGGKSLGTWLGADVTVDLRPGGHLSVVSWDGTRLVGEVDVVRGPHRLAFTWWEQRPFGLPQRSRVELTLEARGRSTVLRMRESRLRPPQVTIDLSAGRRRRAPRSEKGRSPAGAVPARAVAGTAR